MGTTCFIVFKKGGIKFAQLKRVDGHPKVEGVKIYNFLKIADLDKVKEQIDKIKLLKNYEDLKKEVYKEGSYFKSYEERFLDGYLGIDSLINALTDYREIVFLRDLTGIENDCDYLYEIDLDQEKLSVFSRNALLKSFEIKKFPSNKDSFLKKLYKK